MNLSKVLFLLLIPFVCGSFLAPTYDETHDITVKITNIRSKKGKIQLQVYRSEKYFRAENAYKLFFVSKKSLNNKSITYTIKGLKSGTYGLALLDDENSNKEMDYSWGMPEEGFGFSDYYHTAWSRPKFTQFKFQLSGDKKVGMKVRYI